MFGIALKTKEKRPRFEPVSSPTAVPSGNALFEELICQLHWTALQIGGVASVVNSCHALGTGVIPNSCRNQFPVDSSIISAVLLNGGDLNIDTGLISRIGRMMQNLSNAKHVTEPYLGKNVAGSPIVPSQRAVAQLAAVWRKLCEDSLEILSELEPEARWRLNGLYTENSLILNKFLRDASRGKYENVDVHGEVALPILAQRRRTARYALLQPCKILTRRAVYPGFAQDISLHGIGISCKGALKLKEDISVELQIGRRFDGIVVWSKEGMHGVQFHTALPKNDPLIFG